MKRLVVIIFMLALASVSYSQGCKSEKDAFTGEDVISYSHFSRVFFYDYKDGKIFLKMQFNYGGLKEKVFPKGSKFMLKFKDNTIVRLNTIREATPTPNATTQAVITQYMFKFELTEEQLEKFAKSKLTLIRYPGIEEEYLDMDFTKLFTKKYANKFKEGANCILEHMPKAK